MSWACNAITRVVLWLLGWRIRRDPQAGPLAFDALRRGGARKRRPSGAKRVIWNDEIDT